jgi:hypothetical protein
VGELTFRDHALRPRPDKLGAQRGRAECDIQQVLTARNDARSRCRIQHLSLLST